MGKFSRWKIDDFFSYISQKIGFDISCKLSPKETICMNCQILFSGKYKKNISKYLLLNFLPSMLSLEKKWIEKMNRAETWENVPFVVCPAVWSESLLSVWRSFGFLAIHSRAWFSIWWYVRCNSFTKSLQQVMLFSRPKQGHKSWDTVYRSFISKDNMFNV